MNKTECPPEALVLLDEAIEALPAGYYLTDYANNGQPEKYKGPVLSSGRTMEGTPQCEAKDTWTVDFHNKKKEWQGYLEWWDDHWVRVQTSGANPKLWVVAWRGAKVGQ